MRSNSPLSPIHIIFTGLSVAEKTLFLPFLFTLTSLSLSLSHEEEPDSLGTSGGTEVIYISVAFLTNRFCFLSYLLLLLLSESPLFCFCLFSELFSLPQKKKKKKREISGKRSKQLINRRFSLPLEKKTYKKITQTPLFRFWFRRPFRLAK